MARLKEIRSAAARKARRVKRAPLSERLPAFIGGPANAAELLAGLKVAVIGVGSVGRRIALHLARMSVDALSLIDPGTLKPESLLTYEIASLDIGDAKTANAARLCKDISPSTTVFTYEGGIHDVPDAALADADLIVMALDNIAAEVETGRRATALGIPLVHAALVGETMSTEVRVYANRDKANPCPACGLSEAERDAMNRGVKFRCAPDGRRREQNIGPPTMSLSFLCSAAADIALAQIVRYVLKLGKPVADTSVQTCLYTHHSVVSPLTRNPNCGCPHVVYERVISPRPLADCTLREVAALAGVDVGADGVALTVDDLIFCDRGACKCAASRPVRRFVPVGGAAGRCPSCGEPIRADPFFSFARVPASELKSEIDRPVRELGAASAESVIVRASNQGYLVRQSGKEAG